MRKATSTSLPPRPNRPSRATSLLCFVRPPRAPFHAGLARSGDSDSLVKPGKAVRSDALPPRQPAAKRGKWRRAAVSVPPPIQTPTARCVPWVPLTRPKRALGSSSNSTARRRPRARSREPHRPRETHQSLKRTTSRFRSLSLTLRSYFNPSGKSTHAVSSTSTTTAGTPSPDCSSRCSFLSGAGDLTVRPPKLLLPIPIKRTITDGPRGPSLPPCSLQQITLPSVPPCIGLTPTHSFACGFSSDPRVLWEHPQPIPLPPTPAIHRLRGGRGRHKAVDLVFFQRKRERSTDRAPSTQGGGPPPASASGAGGGVGVSGSIGGGGGGGGGCGGVSCVKPPQPPQKSEGELVVRRRRGRYDMGRRSISVDRGGRIVAGRQVPLDHITLAQMAGTRE
ncbi:unnamed protein product [Vitrella brassicaformis CCMP3155]|uniref:Uncharacterized protein n=2 Tax=Vitrella brassicaformis TaxID=1169539 RepID=A0A0G4GHB0_VITBC|nr:unnamed protein product [Vitrella brassicaformis CCMP3155]|eukprot:CEM29148.1 unnamed protein product [Vitrella brassicaformis CCMP3155]